jgi:hypothetical protein
MLLVVWAMSYGWCMLWFSFVSTFLLLLFIGVAVGCGNVVGGVGGVVVGGVSGVGVAVSVGGVVVHSAMAALERDQTLPSTSRMDIRAHAIRGMSSTSCPDQSWTMLVAVVVVLVVALVAFVMLRRIDLTMTW